MEFVIEPGRHARIDHVAVVGTADARSCQPERQRAECMQTHRRRTVECFRQLGHRRMLIADEDHALEHIAEKHRFDGEVTNDDRGNRQQHQRQSHHPWRFAGLLTRCESVVFIIMVRIMSVVRLAEPLFTVKDQEIHSERIERRDEHTGEHGKLGKTCAGNMGRTHRFDDRIF